MLEAKGLAFLFLGKFIKNLEFNYVTSLKPLRKACFPQL
jgi:hypothetical protein